MDAFRKLINETPVPQPHIAVAIRVDETYEQFCARVAEAYDEEMARLYPRCQ